VKSYNGVSSYLVDCLVAPEDIGVCDVRREDGAIRCRRYMVTGGFAVSMYHPSSYAKMLDAEWIEVKAN
jgi:hypothetical protein